MKQWHNCPGCCRVIKYGTNLCPHCKLRLNWTQQPPSPYIPPSGEAQQQVVQQSVETSQQQIIQPSVNPPAKKKSNIVMIALCILGLVVVCLLIADLDRIITFALTFGIIFGISYGIAFYKHSESCENKEAEIQKLTIEKAAEIQKLYAEQKADLEEMATEKSKGFPWLARAYADYLYLLDIKTAEYLKHKSHPARTASETVRETATKRRKAEELYRILKYKLEYYENLFPWLVDFGEEDIDDLIKQILTGDKEQEEPEDAVSVYTTPGERKATSMGKLSRQELFQRALDRYWQKKKTRWEIGRDYERYVGYLYEKDGFSVYYQGIVEGFGDLGRDLIVTKGNSIEIIQCKYWSQDKMIHEKHIFQLFGTTVEYWIKSMAKQNSPHLAMFPELLKQDRVKPVFYTSTKLSEKAKEFAEVLQVHVKENFPLQQYPCIKCNISMRNNEKIYHLPFDQQYDRTLIKEEKNEYYVKTVKEAEAKGFRRAFRWHGLDNKETQPG